MGSKPTLTAICSTTEDNEAPSPEQDQALALKWLRRWREERYPLALMNVLRLMRRSNLTREVLDLTVEEYSQIQAV